MPEHFYHPPMKLRDGMDEWFPNGHPRADTPAWADNTPQADGYCCGRYASYWNAFLMLRMYKIESSTRKTCNHCTSPFWFYTEVFICLVIYSIYIAFLYRLHNVTRHLQYSLVQIFQCFHSYLRFSPLPPRSTLCLQSSFPRRSSHINVRSRFTRSRSISNDFLMTRSYNKP